MRVLGIDPGLNVTGYACLDVSAAGTRAAIVEAGVFRLAAVGGRSDGGAGRSEALARAADRRAAGMAARLAELERDLVGVVERCRPVLAGVESFFTHAKHPATVIAMAHARGVVLLVAKRAGLELVELRPAEVKKSLTGHGAAPKAQMQRAVQARFGLSRRPEPPDVADAIAIALCAGARAV